MPSAPTPDRRMVLGPAVRAIREALGIRHGDFAISCDISPGYLSNLEAGRKQPSPAVAVALAGRLGVPLDAITYQVPTALAATREDAQQ